MPVQYPLDFADRQWGQILIDLTDQPILYRLVQPRSENAKRLRIGSQDQRVEMTAESPSRS